jgi:hypothetical protein
LNACEQASTLKAKLFLSGAAEQEKEFICHGDCVRLRQLEAGAYLTTPTKDVDKLLPTEPDYLKG